MKTEIAMNFENSYGKIISGWATERFKLRTSIQNNAPDLTEEGLIKRENEQIPAINTKYQKQLIELSEKIQNTLIEKNDAVNKIKYPNIYTPAMETEYNNALLFTSNLPEKHIELLKTAINQKRYGFVFTVFDLMMSSSEMISMELEKLLSDLTTELGISSLLNEVQELIQLQNVMGENPITTEENNFNWNSLKFDQKEYLAKHNREAYDEMYKIEYPTQYRG